MRVAHAWLCGAIPTTEVREEALVVGARAAASGVRPHILCRPYNLRFDAQTLDVARELRRIQSQRAGRKGALPLCLHVALQQPMRRSAGADVRSLHPLGKVGKGVAVRVEGESSPAPSTCWDVKTVASTTGSQGKMGGDKRGGRGRHATCTCQGYVVQCGCVRSPRADLQSGFQSRSRSRSRSRWEMLAHASMRAGVEWRTRH